MELIHLETPQQQPSWAVYRLDDQEDAQQQALHDFMSRQADIHTIQVKRLESGKPYLKGQEQYDISMSHTDHHYAVALMYKGAVGIDLEPLDSFDKLERHRHRFLSPGEVKMLKHVTPDKLPFVLLTIWTVKEAVSKLLGLGLSLDFQSFSVVPGTGGLSLLNDQADQQSANLRIVLTESSVDRQIHRSVDFSSWSVLSRELKSTYVLSLVWY